MDVRQVDPGWGRTDEILPVILTWVRMMIYEVALMGMMQTAVDHRCEKAVPRH